MKSILLLSSFLLLFSNINSTETDTALPKEKVFVNYTKVAYQSKTKMIKYYYQSGQLERTLIFNLKNKTASIKILEKKKLIGIVYGSGEKVTYKKYGKGKGILLASALKGMDKYTKLILLNHPIIMRIGELAGLYGNDPNIKKAEEEYINSFSNGISTSSPGTVSSSCSCGSQTVTVTCDTGCGIGCETHSRTRCRLDSQTGETIPGSCETTEYCIGFCACMR